MIMNFSLKTFPVGTLQCNCTLLWDPQTLETIVIDPGDDFQVIKSEIEKNKLHVKTILHTHAHFDHVGASQELADWSKAPLLLHEQDRFLWENFKLQGQFFGFNLTSLPAWNKNLEDEMEITLGSHKLKTLYTPGHTPGSCSFVIQNILFSGDTLFQGSVGRTDLWGGDFQKLSRSIKERFYTLDKDTTVICGHGPQTMIGVERKKNPFVTL